MYSGGENASGNSNAYFGAHCAAYNTTGSNNTCIGTFSGGAITTTSGSNNVFLGYKAGYNETGSDKLYIENSDSDTPLIYGEFDNDILVFNADVGIGTTSPLAELHILKDDTLATLMISPATVNNKSELILAENSTNSYNMSIKYDGGDNRMYIWKINH